MRTGGEGVRHKKQMSDSLMVGLMLAFAGGMLDAYSFVNRGAVFATAETGNIVQLCVHLSMGRFDMAFHYLLPITAFFLGILTAEAIRKKVSGLPNWLHWRQFLVVAECAVLVLVSFLPKGEPDWAANVLISFSSAVQLETFRKFRGCAGATTMCTGNLRSGTELLYKFLALPDPQSGAKATVFYRLILAFALGVILSARLSLFFGGRTVLWACIPLLAVFFLLFRPVRE